DARLLELAVQVTQRGGEPAGDLPGEGPELLLGEVRLLARTRRGTTTPAATATAPGLCGLERFLCERLALADVHEHLLERQPLARDRGEQVRVRIRLLQCLRRLRRLR